MLRTPLLRLIPQTLYLYKLFPLLRLLLMTLEKYLMIYLYKPTAPVFLIKLLPQYLIELVYSRSSHGRKLSVGGFAYWPKCTCSGSSSLKILTLPMLILTLSLPILILLSMTFSLYIGPGSPSSCRSRSARGTQLRSSAPSRQLPHGLP